MSRLNPPGKGWGGLCRRSAAPTPLPSAPNARKYCHCFVNETVIAETKFTEPITGGVTGVAITCSMNDEESWSEKRTRCGQEDVDFQPHRLIMSRLSLNPPTDILC
jgi:hypothetical protein